LKRSRQQAAERLARHLALDHRIHGAVDVDGMDAELGLLVILADAVQQLAAGRGLRGTGQRRQPAALLAEHLGAGFGPVRHRGHPRAAQFVHLVEHRFESVAGPGGPHAAAQHSGTAGAAG
jgi:hypothetical protein